MNPIRKTSQARILCIADVPNWIFDRHIAYLRRHLSDEFEIITTYRGEAYDEQDYDLIYPLEFMLVEPERIQRPDKYITGIRSFISWADWDFFKLVEMLSTKFRRLHTVSSELLDLLSPFLPHMSYVTHGVDLELFKSERPPGDKAGHLRLGWAGNRNTFIKGFWRYIQPLSTLPGIELKICGFADQNLSLEQMPEFYESIDALICASSFEGSNNTLLEAASMERAIITTRVGTVPEYLADRESALIVERDLDQITNAVLELRDDPGLRLNLGRNARKSLVEKHWDWKHRAEIYRRFFRDALGAENGGQARPQNITPKNDPENLLKVLQVQNQLLRELRVGDGVQIYDLKAEKARREQELMHEIDALEETIQEIRSSETYRLMQKVLSNRLAQGLIKLIKKVTD